MIVRCGRCGVQLQVPGPGRFTCPSCGAGNEVPGGAPGSGPVPPPPDPSGGIAGAPAAPEPAAEPSPRARCPECGFSFIVGDIDAAPCPMCGTEVAVGRGGGAE